MSAAVDEIMAMTEPHQSYIKLQRHLDRQAVGFPATKSGAEIRILQHIFSPDEAELATCLTYQPESVETIFQRAKHLVDSPVKLAELSNVNYFVRSASIILAGFFHIDN